MFVFENDVIRIGPGRKTKYLSGITKPKMYIQKKDHVPKMRK